MPKQPAFPGFKHAMKKKATRREVFLSEMDAVVPSLFSYVDIEERVTRCARSGRSSMMLISILPCFAVVPAFHAARWH